MSRLWLRPMSLFELGRSTGRVSLKRVVAGKPVPSLARDYAPRAGWRAGDRADPQIGRVTG